MPSNPSAPPVRRRRRTSKGSGGRQRRRSTSPSPSPTPPSPSPSQGSDEAQRGLWSVYLGLIICHLVWYRAANAAVDGLLGIERVPAAQLGTHRIDWGPLVMLLPLLGLAYHDMYTPSKRFIYLVPDRVMNYVLRVSGGYGIVQVLAQDLGIPSGINQRNIVQTEAVQFLMLWGGAVKQRYFLDLSHCPSR